MTKTIIKYILLAILAIVTLALSALVYGFYSEINFTKPTFFSLVSELCKDLFDSGASEEDLDRCRGEAIVTLRGMLFFWHFALPVLLAWLSVPLFFGMLLFNRSLKRSTVKTLIYLVLVFAFYIFWIKF